jgi:CheY-like chemotaxis protein
MPKPKILVVEDDRSLAEVLEYNLDKAGYEVYKAHDGRDGLNQAQLRLPDIVVLDVMLPVVDGLEVCRQMRASQENRNALIIMLTAKSEEADQLVGFSVGADDYVVKPFSVRVLLERIKALRRRRAEANETEGDTIVLPTARQSHSRLTCDEAGASIAVRSKAEPWNESKARSLADSVSCGFTFSNGTRLPTCLMCMKSVVCVNCGTVTTTCVDGKPRLTPPDGQRWCPVSFASNEIGPTRRRRRSAIC